MTIQGWSVDLKIAQIELQWGGCRSIREILMLGLVWMSYFLAAGCVVISESWLRRTLLVKPDAHQSEKRQKPDPLCSPLPKQTRTIDKM